MRFVVGLLAAVSLWAQSSVGPGNVGVSISGGAGATNLTTAGAVAYVSASGVLNQDQTAAGQIFWDSTNHGLHLGNATASTYKLDLTGNARFADGNAIYFGSSDRRAFLFASSGNNLVIGAGGGATIDRLDIDVGGNGAGLKMLSSGGTNVGPGSDSTDRGLLYLRNNVTTTGSSLVTIALGDADTSSTKQLDLSGAVKFGGSNSTAAVAGVVGVTCPAVTCTAAYTWIKAIAADNSVVYFPVWK